MFIILTVSYASEEIKGKGDENISLQF